MFKQILEYLEHILSKFPYVSRKGFTAQHCFLSMLEKWKKGHSKGTFAQDSRVLTPLLPCLS